MSTIGNWMESWEFNPGQNDETWGSNHQILVEWMENGCTAGKLDGKLGIEHVPKFVEACPCQSKECPTNLWQRLCAETAQALLPAVAS